MTSIVFVKSWNIFTFNFRCGPVVLSKTANRWISDNRIDLLSFCKLLVDQTLELCFGLRAM